MKYGDLFTLNPIETVIQIQHADQEDKAARLVETFVITPSLGDAIEHLVIPQLDFDSGVEGKGIFVVGNYGTGKSHVMSFLSLIAEDAAYLDRVRDPDWRPKLARFAGRYRVRRCEIGGSLDTLYGIITRELEALGRRVGIQGFTFADQRQLTSVKSELLRFMQAFDSVCPNHGVLLVVDEVLNYLRSRDDASLVLDMEVLRSLGEFCNGSRFAIMLGVQEMLFNNPRFSHIADDVNRVRQRFHDFVIDSKSVSQLVEQYLFAKSGTQREQIRELMQRQTRLYEVVGTDLERFVALFPAHPSFVDEFQKVSVVERREVLTVLTQEARKLQDREVTADRLELITPDRYWKHIEQDTGLNANQAVRQVKGIVSVLSEKIRAGLPDTEDKPAAQRLIEGLAVHRLTTPGITDPVGMTPEQLKNNLLWYTPIPMQDATFLTSAAKRLLDRIRDAANGQFLVESDTSGQYYIDPTRVRDFEQEVRTRAAVLPNHVVQRYLNEIVTRALELDNEQPVQENRLWNYGLIWASRNVERPGWLFFGYPNQRSTARPPKDFYLFMIPSTRITGNSGEDIPNAPDEAYWFFEDFPPARYEIGDDTAQPSVPETFLDFLRLYAAAREIAKGCPRGDEETAFTNIARKYLGILAPAFAENAGDWVSVQWNGQRKRLKEWVMAIDPGKAMATFRTKLDAVSESMFAPHFEDEYREYPAFEVRIQERTRHQNAQAAIETLCEVGMQTQTGWAVLRALGLAKDETIMLDQSPWLAKLRKRLKPLQANQVLNHSDLFERVDDKWWFKGECIEAEWLHVVIAAGIRTGDLVVYGPNNKRFDAANLKEFYYEIKTFDDILRVGKPSEIPYDQWRRLFELFGINTGLLATPGTHDEAIREFSKAVQETINDMIETERAYSTRPPFLQEETAQRLHSWCESFGKVQRALETYLQPINTKAKMRNLKMTDVEIEMLAEHLHTAKALIALQKLLQETQVASNLGAIDRFRAILDERSDDFTKKAEVVVAELNAVCADPTTLEERKEALTTAIADAVASALAAYQSLHKKHRLDADGDERKQRLVGSAELKRLNRLARIGSLSHNKLKEVHDRLDGLVTCKGCTDQEVLNNARSLCPKCSFNPKELKSDEAALDVLVNCEDRVRQIEEEWTAELLKDLKDPAVRSSIELLPASHRDLIEDFVEAKTLPEEITDEFINAVNLALSGLKRRAVKAKDFVESVLGHGEPLRADEVVQRLNEWLKAEIGSDNRNAVRFVLEE